MIGWTFHIKTDCPKCGRAMNNSLPMGSLFWNLTCTNEDCSLRGVSFLVEKSTAVCIGSSATVGYEYEPTWPADWVNRHGEYVMRGGKPVPEKSTDWVPDQTKSYAAVSSATEFAARRVPRMAEQGPVPAQNTDTTSPVLPEPLEKMAWDFFYRATGSELEINTIKSALYKAYLTGAQSERSNTMASKMNKV